MTERHHSSAKRFDASHPVTVVTDNFGGGTGRHLVDMLRHRDLDRWPTRILCYGVDDGLRPPAAVPYRRRRFRRWYVRFPVPQLRVVFDLARQLPGRGILHTYFFWPIMYGRVLKRFGRVEALVENREDTGFKWGPLHRWMLRRLRDAPDLVICVSEAVKSAAIENEGLAPSKVMVIENGVSIPEEPSVAQRRKARDRFGVALDDVVVGMISNLNRRVKGVDRFIDAMPAILARAPNARFVIAGDGHLRPELESQARSLNVADRLMFVGHLDDVEDLYRALDISVLTSHSEGLSITLLESMAHGLPVVVTAVGGNVEVVVDGETGFLVPSGDQSAFVGAVTGLCSDARARTRMGEAARRRCGARFDVASVSKRYEGRYQGLVSGP